MSVGGTGPVGGAAGSHLPQTRGTDIDKVAQDISQQARHVQAGRREDDAAGVGQTEQHEAARDRDADGRQPWQISNHQQSGVHEAHDAQRASKDSAKQKGNRLDVSG